jgi:hypothetical protein
MEEADVWGGKELHSRLVPEVSTADSSFMHAFSSMLVHFPLAPA